MFQFHIFIGAVNKQAREISGRVRATGIAIHIPFLTMATYMWKFSQCCATWYKDVLFIELGNIQGVVLVSAVYPDSVRSAFVRSASFSCCENPSLLSL